jgi:2,4-dienoyl-CoA reductase-like NADH-dependent reductase (Old Yellow Enzyme family)
MTTGSSREGYRLFSTVKIGPLRLSNRLVRSATWDPTMVFSRQVDDTTLETYRRLARGGVAMIIVGDFDVVPKQALEMRLDPNSASAFTYDDVRIRDFPRLADAVHHEAPGTSIIAQVSAHVPGKGVSPVPSPFSGKAPAPLSPGEIKALVEFFGTAIEGVRDDGFDGAQLHAAHGGLLCRFLSPYSNRRQDAYGGSSKARTRFFLEILRAARARAGDFPVLIKMNGTDHVTGGIDTETLAEQAALLAGAGFDAIEMSGGMPEALLLPEEELGFPPVPAAESHTRISDPAKQSYFLPYARAMDIDVPVLLTGGNLDAERLERILLEGGADLIGLSRPLIREPDLPNRWRAGRGPTTASCLSCNGCIYDLNLSCGERGPQRVRCLVDEEPARLGDAKQWLDGWSARASSRSS